MSKVLLVLAALLSGCGTPQLWRPGCPNPAQSQLELAAAARRAGDREGEKDALTRLAHDDQAPAYVASAAAGRAAHLAEGDGQREDAEALRTRAIEVDASARAPVRAHVAGLLAAKRPDAVAALCRSLHREGRTAQARECLQSAGRNAPVRDQLWVDVIAAVPGITAADALAGLRTRTSVVEALPGLAACMATPVGLHDHSADARRDTYAGTAASGPDATALYDRLARGEGAERHERARCFASHAAWMCFGRLSRGQSCASSSSLARYGELLAHEEPTAWHAYQAQLFERRPTVRELAGPHTTRPLYQLALSAWHLYSKYGAGPARHQTPAYHKSWTLALWAGLNKRRRFPEWLGPGGRPRGRHPGAPAGTKARTSPRPDGGGQGE